MLASGSNGTLYVGVTSDLVRRIAAHREGAMPGFTERYGVKRLVWYETHDSIAAAIRCLKRLRKWPRAWKVAPIEAVNPNWRDLWAEITG
jgi:putative endonuclease